MSATAVLDLKVTGFIVGLDAVNRGLKAVSSTAAQTGRLMGSALSKGISGIAGLVKGLSGASVGAFAGLGAGIYEAMNQGGELVDLQEQTGVSIEKLMQLRVAFEQAGLGAEDVQPAIAKLQKSIVGAQTGSESAQKAFEALGLSADNLAQSTADEQLRLVGESIANIENPALKSAVAMEVFGKSGGRMLAFFAAGGLDEAAAAIGQQGQLMAKYADTFDSITDSFGLYQTKLRGFFVGIAAELAPILKMAADWFKDIDLTSIGQSVGNTIATIYETIAAGNLGSLLSSQLEIAFAESVNLLWDLLKATFASVKAFFSGFFEGLQNYFSGLGNTLIGAGKMFGSIIMDAIGKVLSSMQKLPLIGEKFGSFGANLQEKAAILKKSGETQTSQGITKMYENTLNPENFIDKIIKSAKAFVEEIKKSESVPLIDTQAEQENVDRILARGRELAAQAQTQLGAKAREAEPPKLERDILDVLGKREAPSRASQVFGMFGSVGGGTVRGSFQSLDPMVAQQKFTNALLKQVVDNTNKGTSMAAPAYQK